jgi:predicted Co/Zn/Cd cation transporter (cation efflux family)
MKGNKNDRYLFLAVLLYFIDVMIDSHSLFASTSLFSCLVVVMEGVFCLVDLKFCFLSLTMTYFFSS